MSEIADARQLAEMHSIPWSPKTYSDMASLTEAVRAVWPRATYHGSVPPNMFLREYPSTGSGTPIVAIVWWAKRGQALLLRATIAPSGSKLPPWHDPKGQRT